MKTLRLWALAFSEFGMACHSPYNLSLAALLWTPLFFGKGYSL